MFRIMRALCISIGVLLLANVANGQSIAKPLNFTWEEIYPDKVLTFTWSPDGEHIAFIDNDLQNIHILNVHTKIVERKINLPSPVKDSRTPKFSWSPDGSYFALAMNGQAYVIDAQNGNILIDYVNAFDASSKEYTISNIRWARDSSSVAAFSYRKFIDVVDIKTGKTLKTIDFHDNRGLPAYAAFDWSPDNSRFAADQNTLFIGIWDSNGKPIVGHGKEDASKNVKLNCPGIDYETPREIISLNWSIDSASLAVGSDIGLWICKIGEDNMINYKYIDNGVNVSSVWSPDAKWLVTSSISPIDDLTNKCELKAFDVKGDYKAQTITVNSTFCAYALSWSPNSQQLAARSEGHLWLGTKR